MSEKFEAPRAPSVFVASEEAHARAAEIRERNAALLGIDAN